MADHSEAFRAVRDAIVALPDAERARLARLFGCMTEPHRRLGVLREILHAAGALTDHDLERLASWFSAYVNSWGQMPRAAGRSVPGYGYAKRPP